MVSERSGLALFIDNLGATDGTEWKQHSMSVLCTYTSIPDIAIHSFSQCILVFSHF